MLLYHSQQFSQVCPLPDHLFFLRKMQERIDFIPPIIPNGDMPHLPGVLPALHDQTMPDMYEQEKRCQPPAGGFLCTASLFFCG